MADLYYSMQGKVYLANRNATTGKAEDMRWVGNVSAANIELTTETVDKNESWSGNRALAARLITSKTGTFTATFDEIKAENLALMTHGESADVTASSVVDEPVAFTVAQYDYAQTEFQFISNVVITDSNGTPVTLVENTDYVIDSAAGGVIRFISDPSTFTQPFLVSYDYSDFTRVVAFTQAAAPEYWVRFDGVNTLTDEALIIDIYRASFEPASLDVINEEFGGMEFSAGMLYDTINADDSATGGYMRVIKPTEV